MRVDDAVALTSRMNWATVAPSAAMWLTTTPRVHPVSKCVSLAVSNAALPRAWAQESGQ